MAGNVPLDLIFFMGRGHHHSNHAIHDRNFTLPKNSTRKTSNKTKLWLSKCRNIPRWTSFKIHSNLFSSFFAYKSYLRSRSFPKSYICAGKQTESSDGSSHFPSIQIHHFWHCTSLIRWKQYWYKMCDYFTRKVLLACEKKRILRRSFLLTRQDADTISTFWRNSFDVEKDQFFTEGTRKVDVTT